MRGRQSCITDFQDFEPWPDTLAQVSTEAIYHELCISDIVDVHFSVSLVYVWFRWVQSPSGDYLFIGVIGSSASATGHNAGFSINLEGSVVFENFGFKTFLGQVGPLFRVGIVNLNALKLTAGVRYGLDFFMEIWVVPIALARIMDLGWGLGIN